MESGFIVAEHGDEGSFNLLILGLVILGVAALLVTILVIQQRDPGRAHRMEIRRVLLSGPPPRVGGQPGRSTESPATTEPRDTTNAGANEASSGNDDTGSPSKNTSAAEDGRGSTP